MSNETKVVSDLIDKARDDAESTIIDEMKKKHPTVSELSYWQMVFPDAAIGSGSGGQHATEVS